MNGSLVRILRNTTTTPKSRSEEKNVVHKNTTVTLKAKSEDLFENVKIKSVNSDLFNFEHYKPKNGDTIYLDRRDFCFRLSCAVPKNQNLSWKEFKPWVVSEVSSGFKFQRDSKQYAIVGDNVYYLQVFYIENCLSEEKGYVKLLSSSDITCGGYSYGKNFPYNFKVSQTLNYRKHHKDTVRCFFSSKKQTFVVPHKLDRECVLYLIRGQRLVEAKMRSLFFCSRTSDQNLEVYSYRCKGISPNDEINICTLGARHSSLILCELHGANAWCKIFPVDKYSYTLYTKGSTTFSCYLVSDNKTFQVINHSRVKVFYNNSSGVLTVENNTLRTWVSLTFADNRIFINDAD